MDLIRVLFVEAENTFGNDQEKLIEMIRELLFHSLHCKFHRMVYEVKYFLQKLIDSIEKDIHELNINADCGSILETIRLKKFEKNINLYFENMIDEIISNIQYLFTRNIFSDFKTVFVSLDNQKVKQCLGELIKIYIFIGHDLMQKAFESHF